MSNNSLRKCSVYFKCFKTPKLYKTSPEDPNHSNIITGKDKTLTKQAHNGKHPGPHLPTAGRWLRSREGGKSIYPICSAYFGSEALFHSSWWEPHMCMLVFSFFV